MDRAGEYIPDLRPDRELHADGSSADLIRTREHTAPSVDFPFAMLTRARSPDPATSLRLSDFTFEAKRLKRSDLPMLPMGGAGRGNTPVARTAGGGSRAGSSAKLEAVTYT
jgi:hypothetical protein